MPLTLSILESRMQGRYAPDNPIEFRRLVNEADDRALASGNWHWTREQATLYPIDGVVTLPQKYRSILACKVGDSPKDIQWQESDFLEDQAGMSVPILGGKGRLLDIGLHPFPDGNIFINQNDTEEVPVSGVMIRLASTQNARSVYTSTGTATAPDDNQWIKVSWSGTYWSIIAYEGASIVGEWRNNDDVLTPDLVSTDWAAIVADGSPIVSANQPVLRQFRISEADNLAITILARFQAQEMALQTDSPVCQNFRALKAAIQAIVYEENNDLERSHQYESNMMMILAQDEDTYRGSAKRIYKPQPQGLPYLHGRRRTNSP